MHKKLCVYAQLTMHLNGKNQTAVLFQDIDFSLLRCFFAIVVELLLFLTLALYYHSQFDIQY